MKKDTFLKKAFISFFEDDVPSMAAQLAFYINVAFFPFIVFMFIIISTTPLLGEENLYDLISILPNQTANLVYDVLHHVSTSKSIAIASGVVSLWSMSNAIVTITKALNKFYDVEENRNFIKTRLIGIFFAILILVTILLNFVLILAGSLIGSFLIKFWPRYYVLWNVLRILVPFALMSVLFAFIYKTLPNINLSFKKSFLGAIFSSVMWTIFSAVFSYYVNNFAKYDIIYGSIAGVVVLITWVFISSYIILIGGEINAFKAGYFHKKEIKRKIR
ncbi:MAG: YihY/virulence factor BrkB family protein [Ruminococcaceae bacterium]|nr:YihY/virulence factor BrkB family protein [Oscillospiraceae bacterium]